MQCPIPPRPPSPVLRLHPPDASEWWGRGEGWVRRRRRRRIGLEMRIRVRLRIGVTVRVCIEGAKMYAWEVPTECAYP